MDIQPAERGYYGETWKAVADGRAYFVKIVTFPPHMERYRRSFAGLAAMCDRGIDFVSRIIPAADGLLCCDFAGGVLGVFAYEEGIHTEAYPLEQLFAKLARIYALPIHGMPIPREDFNTEYIHLLEEGTRRLGKSDDPVLLEAYATLREQRQELALCERRLLRIAERCRNAGDFFVVTSGDVGGNVLMDEGRMVIIDWDWLILAPPERDIWPYLYEQHQLDLFRNVLARNGIGYRPRPERLAFYALRSHLYYLHEYVQGMLYIEDPENRKKLLDTMREYFQPDCWVLRNLRRIGEYGLPEWDVE